MAGSYSPIELEVIDDAKVYHLADGVFIEQSRNGNNVYYLIDSTVADCELTAEGLAIELSGENAGTYSTSPALEVYVAAWITEVPGEGPGITRFQIDDTTHTELLPHLTAAMTVRDFYDHKQWITNEAVEATADLLRSQENARLVPPIAAPEYAIPIKPAIGRELSSVRPPVRYINGVWILM